MRRRDEVNRCNKSMSIESFANHDAVGDVREKLTAL